MNIRSFLFVDILNQIPELCGFSK